MIVEKGGVTSISRPISEDMITSYVALTGDAFPIHSDAAFARQMGFKGLVVPGNLVTAMGTGLVHQSGLLKSVVVQTRKDIQFRHPVYVGDRLYVRDTVLRSIDGGCDRGYLVIDRDIRNQDHVTVQRVRQVYQVACDGLSATMHTDVIARHDHS